MVNYLNTIVSGNIHIVQVNRSVAKFPDASGRLANQIVVSGIMRLGDKDEGLEDMRVTIENKAFVDKFLDLNDDALNRQLENKNITFTGIGKVSCKDMQESLWITVRNKDKLEVVKTSGVCNIEDDLVKLKINMRGIIRKLEVIKDENSDNQVLVVTFVHGDKEVCCYAPFSDSYNKESVTDFIDMYKFESNGKPRNVSTVMNTFFEITNCTAMFYNILVGDDSVRLLKFTATEDSKFKEYDPKYMPQIDMVTKSCIGLGDFFNKQKLLTQ